MKTRKRKQKSFSYNFQKGKIGQSVIVIITVIVFGLFFVGAFLLQKRSLTEKPLHFQTQVHAVIRGMEINALHRLTPIKK